jgi:hypothetical protein
VIESGLCFLNPNQVERQIAMHRICLGVETRTPVSVCSNNRDNGTGYIEYRWPARRLVRCFETITPVMCARDEVIAEWAGMPVGLKRRVGKGEIIFLGSPLGMGLFAEEAEAIELGRAMLDA